MDDSEITLVNPDLVVPETVRNADDALALYNPSDSSTFRKIPWRMQGDTKSWFTACLPWDDTYVKLGVNVYYDDVTNALDLASGGQMNPDGSV